MNKYKMTSSDYLLSIGAMILFIIGLLISAAIIMVIASEPNKELTAKLVILVFLGIFPIILALYFNKKLKNNKKAGEKTELEQSVLHAARNRGGILSASELALDEGIPLETAKRILDNMQVKGFAVIDVTDEGEIIYKVHV